MLLAGPLAGFGVVAAQSATFTLPNQEQVLSGSEAKVTLACTNNIISITGNNNVVSLNGSCLQVIVEGDNNKITTQTIGKFTLRGQNNILSWHKALTGDRPSIELTGLGNKISKR